MRILIAEDDQVLADGLLRSLRSRPATRWTTSRNGSEADAAWPTHEFDLLILDLGLPKMHGLEVLRKMRARGSSVPVLILTAADSVERARQGPGSRRRRLHGQAFLAAGAGSARARADAARAWAVPATTHQAWAAELSTPAGRVAYINEQMVELSARELSLLEVLLQRAGRLVSKDQLVERLCEWGEEVSNNAIEVYIHRLRKKIEQGPIRIATVRGLGYCLEKIAA